MNRLFYMLFFLLLSFRISAMTNTEAIQYVNRYYDLLNQYAVVKNDAPGLARQITSLHVENAGSIYPDIEVKLGGLPDTKGVVISTYLTSISDPERKKSMLLKFVPKGITIKSNSGGVTCVSYTLYVYDDNATPNSSVLKYSVPLEMRINQYYKIKSITKCTNGQENDDTPKTPNVSRKVLTHNGHEYVDLGLSVMWATCNVGAESPEEYGDYFAWGEIETKSTYNERTYKCKKFSYWELPPYHDAAYANWRSTWRMPTDDEWAELCERCIWTWITEKGVNGYNVTSKINGNSIFLPAAGIRYVETHRDRGPYNIGGIGNYWSKSRYDSNFATQLQFSSRAASVHFYAFRDWGLSVRPVFSPH